MAGDQAQGGIERPDIGFDRGVEANNKFLVTLSRLRRAQAEYTEPEFSARTLLEMPEEEWERIKHQHTTRAQSD